MPKGKTKKFIDKKNSVTFHLVHRSQQDPLAADETAPQHVLVPVDSGATGKPTKNPVDAKKRKEELQKYGIFFDDDYDYLQHLKDVSTVPVEWARVEQPNDSTKEKIDAPKINLPSSVFASAVEERIGLLNKAAPISGPRLDLDPDVVAAMDDDFDYDNPDNELEDDFIQLANGEMTDNEFNEDDEYNMNSDDCSDVSSGQFEDSDEERDEVCSLNGPQYSFKNEETKSRFTEYSMSSSVMRRNEQLELLDHKFEKIYAQYDDNEIGALDCEEIEGYIPPDSEIVMQCVAEFEKQQKEATENVAKLMNDRLKIIEVDELSSDDDLEKLTVDPRKKDQWDCESILTTCSTLYNHPKLIAEPRKGLGKIKINNKTGIPEDVLTGRPGKLTKARLAQLDEEYQATKNPYGPRSVAGTIKSVLSELSVRPKNELPEERKDRKKALKEYRKKRREERKANTEAFKDEKKRQEKIILNNKQNIQGNRIY